MKLKADSCYDYQIMDCSQDTVTKYLDDEKTHATINSTLFKKLNHVNSVLYEIELTKAETEQQKPNHSRVFHPSIRKTLNV